MEDQEEEMKFVAEGLRAAYKNRLLAELVYFALQAMKDDPLISISQAINEARREWDV